MAPARFGRRGAVDQPADGDHGRAASPALARRPAADRVDSTYVINCFRDKWWVRWQANGWKNAKKEPVANVDLWKPLIELVVERSPRFRWVKGHSGDPMNDLVDAMAVAASKGPFNTSLPGLPSLPDDPQGTLFDA